jgi:hypothetical protein
MRSASVKAIHLLARDDMKGTSPFAEFLFRLRSQLRSRPSCRSK